MQTGYTEVWQYFQDGVGFFQKLHRGILVKNPKKSYAIGYNRIFCSNNDVESGPWEPALPGE